MKIETREEHFVTFTSPGTFFCEESSVVIDTWNIARAVEISKTITERHGATPFAFKFGTRLVAVESLEDGRGGTLDVAPREIACSCRHFLGGQIYEYSDVEASQDPAVFGRTPDMLLSNMRSSGWPFVLINNNSYRSTQPFEETDVVVDDSGVIVRRGDEPELVGKRRAYLERWANQGEGGT